MTSNDTQNVSYEEEELGYHIYYLGLMGFLMCVNIPGNIIVMTTILRHQELHLYSNYFLVNQAVADLLYGILYPIYNFAQLTIVPAIAEEFAHYWGCTVFISQVITVVVASPLNLMFVTADRYIAIVFPYHYTTFVTSKSTTIVIASHWIFCELFSVCMHVIYPPNEEFRKCRYEDMYTLVQTLLLNLVCGLIPFVVMTTLYIKIVQIVRYQTRQIRVQERAVERITNGDAMRAKKTNISDKKSIALISLLLAFYMCAWTPILMYFLYVYLHKDHPSAYLRATCRILVFTNSCVNVFVYSFRLQNFRKYMMQDLRLFRRYICGCQCLQGSVRKNSNGLSIIVSEANERTANYTQTINCH